MPYSLRHARPGSALLVGLSLSLACATAPPTELDVRQLVDLAAAPRDPSSPLKLEAPRVLNRSDFVYALAFTPDSQRLAYVHHVTVDMELSVQETDARTPAWRRPINHHQYDVEDVAFMQSPSERVSALAVPSRQGIARRFDEGLEAPDAFVYGAALTRVAVSPSGAVVAFGGADGRVLLLDAERWAFLGEAQVHEDEVQGLSFLSDDRLLSVSFDGTVRESRLERGTPRRFSVHATRLDDGARAFLAHLDGKRALTVVRDVRQPMSVISSAAVARLGLAPLLDQAPATVVTPLGPELRPVVDVGELQLRYLRVGPLRAAVCDECVPRGAELVLGAPVLRHVLLGDDLGQSKVWVSQTTGTAEEKNDDGEPPFVSAVDDAVQLVEARRTALPGPACDLDVSPATGHAVVAYSHTRARRDPDLYDAEKRGLYPPRSAASGAVLLDLATLKLGRRYVGHEGFTVTAALSPDGRTLATGGWDKRMVLFDVDTGEVITERRLGWLARRARFAPDGQRLAVASWTKANPIGDGASDPSLQVYPLRSAR